jgi:hypothetical protein
MLYRQCVHLEKCERVFDEEPSLVINTCTHKPSVRTNIVYVEHCKSLDPSECSDDPSNQCYLVQEYESIAKENFTCTYQL